MSSKAIQIKKEKSKLKKIQSLINNISEWTGRIFSFAVVLLTLLAVFEVVLRKIFNSPTIWSFEVSKQIYSFHFLMVAAFTLLHGAHVSVDIIYERLSSRTQAILDSFSYIILFFPFWIIIFIEGIKFSAASWAIRETGMGIFQIPLYPIKTIIPIAAFLLIIQGGGIFIGNLHTVIKVKEND